MSPIAKRDFGIDADDPDVFWDDDEDEKTVRLHIQPFGDFIAPREIKMDELVKNLFFPHLVRKESSPQDDIFHRINHDFIGVVKV